MSERVNKREHGNDLEFTVIAINVLRMAFSMFAIQITMAAVKCWLAWLVVMNVMGKR